MRDQESNEIWNEMDPYWVDEKTRRKNMLTNFGRKVEIIKKNKVTRKIDVLEKGYFNEWVKTENCVMVIIELEDGTIKVEHSSDVRFVDKIKSSEDRGCAFIVRDKLFSEEYLKTETTGELEKEKEEVTY